MKRILLPSNKDDTISLPPYVDFRAEDNRVAPWDNSVNFVIKGLPAKGSVIETQQISL
jgi:hypothetical protein